MHKIIIYGNSGSGKSTMAINLSKELGLIHLDLDTLAWKSPGVREEIGEAHKKLTEFMKSNKYWIAEGCYGSLVEFLLPYSTELRFLNPGLEACIENTQRRPWEPHKFASPSLQEKNLENLKKWVEDYDLRTDEFSLTFHRRIYEDFDGIKREYTSINS